MALADHEPTPNSGKGGLMPNVPPRREAAGRANAVNRGAMEQYQRAQVESASPTRLIVLLYEGAIRFCSLAQDAMQKGDLEIQNANLIRAQRIIGELLGSLNRNAGGEVAANLARIYTHMLGELVRANLYDDQQVIRQVTALLMEMRASWAEIDRLQSGDHSAQPAPPAGDKAQPHKSGQDGRPHLKGANSLTGVRPIRPTAAAPAPSGGVTRLDDRLA
jgi:flagellar protein FliS